MDYSKELLLFAATTVVSAGAAAIAANNIWQGVVLIVIGAILFVGRGFYKKYLEDKNQ